MGFRFRRSINLGGGTRMNISKTGIGFSSGIKGARFTKTADGRYRSTYSIPGTGLSYVSESGGRRRGKKKFGFGTIIVIVLVGLYILGRLGIGTTSPTGQTDQTQTRERAPTRDRNEPIELTGTLAPKTPYEVFNETTPYDLGTPAFAGMWSSPPRNDVGSSGADADSTHNDYPYNHDYDGETGRDMFLESDIFNEINNYRAGHNVNSLVWDEDLFKYAEIRAWEILETDKFEHERPNGDMWWDLLLNDNYEVWAANENLARVETYVHEFDGTPARMWIELWASSPPHYAEMISSEYTHLAICVVYAVNNGVITEIVVTLYASY